MSTQAIKSGFAENQNPSGTASSSATAPATTATATSSATPPPDGASDEAAFHKLFPSVPSTEAVVQDYQCSLLKNRLMRVGRLYLTHVRCCFSGLLCEPVMLEWERISDIQKKSTMIFDQVVVTAVMKPGEPPQAAAVFTGFMNGSDQPFKMMKALWSVRGKYANVPNSNAPTAQPAADAAAVAAPVYRSVQPQWTGQSSSTATTASTAAAAAAAPVVAATTAATPKPAIAAASTANESTKDKEPVNTSTSAAAATTTTTPALTTSQQRSLSPSKASNTTTTTTVTEVVPRSPPTSMKEPAAPAAPQGHSTGSDVDNDSAGVSNSSLAAPPTSFAFGPGGIPSINGSVASHQRVPSLTDELPTVGIASTAPSTATTVAASTSSGSRNQPVPVVTSTPPLKASDPAKGSSVPHGPRSPSDELRAREDTATPPAAPLDPPASASNIRSPQSAARFTTVVEPPATTAAPATATVEKAPQPPAAVAPAAAAAPTAPATQVPGKIKKKPKDEVSAQPGDAEHAAAAPPAAMFGSSPGPSTSTAAPTSAPVGGGQDILKWFPTVPKNEIITDQFQCSYAAGVHRIGKMYVSSHYILFSSMMMQETIALKIADVLSIEKSSSLLVLEGITVTMREGGVKHEFTSFANRDRAFQLIGTFHQSAPPPPPPAPPVVSSIASIVSGSDSSAAASPAAPSPPSTRGRDVATVQDASPAAGAARAASPAPEVQKPFTSSAVQPDHYFVCDSLDEFDKFGSDWGTAGISEAKNFLTAKPIIPDFDLPFGCSLNDVFRQLYDDDMPFLTEYHLQRRDTESKWEKWRRCVGPHAEAVAGYGCQRRMDCKTVVRALGEQITNFVEYQKAAFIQLPDGTRNFLIQFSGQALGVIFSETFRAENLMVYTERRDRVSKLPQVTVRTYGYVNFLKWSVAKAKISSQCGIEMPGCYNKVNEMSHARLVAVAQDAIARNAASNPSAAAAVVVPTRAELGVPSPVHAPASVAGTASSAPSSAFAAVGSTPAVAAAPIPAQPVLTGVYKTVALVLLGLAAYCLLWTWWGAWRADPVTAAASFLLSQEPSISLSSNGTGGGASGHFAVVAGMAELHDRVVRPLVSALVYLLLTAILYVAASLDVLPKL